MRMLPQLWTNQRRRTLAQEECGTGPGTRTLGGVVADQLLNFRNTDFVPVSVEGHEVNARFQRSTYHQTNSKQLCFRHFANAERLAPIEFSLESLAG